MTTRYKIQLVCTLWHFCNCKYAIAKKLQWANNEHIMRNVYKISLVCTLWHFCNRPITHFLHTWQLPLQSNYPIAKMSKCANLTWANWRIAYPHCVRHVNTYRYIKTSWIITTAGPGSPNWPDATSEYRWCSKCHQTAWPQTGNCPCGSGSWPGSYTELRKWQDTALARIMTAILWSSVTLKRAAQSSHSIAPPKSPHTA